MADEADIANDLIANEVLSVLAKMRQQDSIGHKMGPKECMSCGEKIPTERRRLGFKVCVECAEASERRKSLFAEY